MSDRLAELLKLARNESGDTSDNKPPGVRVGDICVFDSFDSLGIGADALKKYLGHDVGPLDLPALRELYTAIKQGEVIWSDLIAEREEPVQVSACDAK